ncbi:MAG: MFS transporter [Burkholderiales bacterium]|nr:MFS transporter [Burkholderiales bacterium]
MPTDDIALPSQAAPSSGLRRVAIPALFFLLGVLYASWAARLPTIRETLSLDAARLGTVLLGGGIGSVLSYPLAAWLVGHHGARHAALWAGLGLAALFPMLPWIGDWRGLMLGLLLLGVLTSSFDVAINALGAEAEQDAGRPIMSMLHAWFCVGTFVGALLGSLVAYWGISPALHFGVVSLVMVAVIVPTNNSLPCDRPTAEASGGHFTIPHGALIALGLIAFLGAVSEGSLTNWIPLYLREHLHASIGTAPLGYAAFAGAMLAARLVGDRLKERVGARRLLSASSLVGAAGIGLAVIAPSVALSIPGLVLAGLGVAAVFPCIFSAAGREGAGALASVATLGYAGGLFGPPLMGFVVHWHGMQAGFVVLAAISIAVSIAGGRARLLK